MADLYAQELGDAVVVPAVPQGLASAWAQYSILVPGRDRDAVIAKLREAGVPSMIYYPKPLHLQEAYAGLGYAAGDFPVSEQASRDILSLPMHPYLEEGQIREIAAAVRAAL